jgi:NADPH:quinone reductase-like Zn-dependent oxidoreductase
MVRPANWFTHAPVHYSHAEAATLTTSGLTVWRALVTDGLLKAGSDSIDVGYGRGVAVRLAVRKNDGCIDDSHFLIG